MTGLFDSSDFYAFPSLFIHKMLIHEGIALKSIVLTDPDVAEITVPDPELFQRYLAQLMATGEGQSLADVLLSEQLAGCFSQDSPPIILELVDDGQSIHWRRTPQPTRTKT